MKTFKEMEADCQLKLPVFIPYLRGGYDPIEEGSEVFVHSACKERNNHVLDATKLSQYFNALDLEKVKKSNFDISIFEALELEQIPNYDNLPKFDSKFDLDELRANCSHSFATFGKGMYGVHKQVCTKCGENRLLKTPYQKFFKGTSNSD